MIDCYSVGVNYDAASCEAASKDNYIIMTSNWMAWSWWSLNILLLYLVNALGLKISLIDSIFYPMTHMIFTGDSVTPSHS